MTYWHLLFTMSVMMLGISAAMAPATDTLMASVPRNRSGMGSAMNDTTRELGGALGVAILGAMISSLYSQHIKSVADQFSGAASEAVSTSLASALAVADRAGIPAAELEHSARVAWMDGLNAAALVAAGIITACLVVALIFLPKRVVGDEE